MKEVCVCVLTQRRAQWLRDTGNQFAHLYKLLPQDKNLKALVKAVINTESRYIYQYPYCGMQVEVCKSAILTGNRIFPASTRIGTQANSQRLCYESYGQSVGNIFP